MEKKRKVKIDSYTQARESYSFDLDMKATSATENVFTKDDFLFDKVILNDKMEEKSAKGKSKTSE